MGGFGPEDGKYVPLQTAFRQSTGVDRFGFHEQSRSRSRLLALGPRESPVCFKNCVTSSDSYSKPVRELINANCTTSSLIHARVTAR